MDEQERARQLVELAWGAIESGRFDALDLLMSENVELETATGRGTGRDHAKRVFERHMAVYPDMRHAVLASVESCDGQEVALEMAFTGTHQGELRTPRGVFAPTGRALTWRSSDHIRARNGRIVRWRAYFDRLALLEQLERAGPD